MTNKISFNRRQGAWEVYLNNDTVISADVTLTVDWEHANRLQTDPIGKVVVTGSDGIRYELFTPGSSGSASFTFPVNRDYGRRYRLSFDPEINAEISPSTTRRLRLFHPGISVDTIERETFITKEGNDWGLKIPNGVAAGSRVTFYMQRNDDPDTYGTALTAFECPVPAGEGRQYSNNRMSFNNDDSRDSETEEVNLGGDGGQFYKFDLFGTQKPPVRNQGGSWDLGDFPQGPRLEFFDREGNDVNAFLHIQEKRLRALDNQPRGGDITITATNMVLDGGTTSPPPVVIPPTPIEPGPGPPPPPITIGPSECGPGPWKINGSTYDPDSVVAPVAPSIDDSGGGQNLVCTKDGDKDIILDLRNYANKLVTLELTYRIDADWTQKFNFNIPNCSDLYVDSGRLGGDGNEYNFPPYSHATNTANKVFKIYNLDGGYEYKFKHDSITGPEPIRDVFELVCVTTETEVDNDDGGTDTVETTICECEFVRTETWTETGGSWPRFQPEVFVTKSSGTSVSWVYDDGYGTANGAPDDVYVNVTVKRVRDTVPFPPATLYLRDTIQRLAWTPSDTPDTDYNYGLVDGQSLADFYDHSDKIRLRVPTEKRSLLNLRAGGADMSEFRGCAGATYDAF